MGYADIKTEDDEVAVKPNCMKIRNAGVVLNDGMDVELAYGGTVALNCVEENGGDVELDSGGSVEMNCVAKNGGDVELANEEQLSLVQLNIGDNVALVDCMKLENEDHVELVDCVTTKATLEMATLGTMEPATLARLDSDVPEEIDGVFFDDNYDMMVEEEEISDGDETESSIDLLIRFLQSMFKKLSRRAKKASRSMLPAVISPQLVSFAVDGILLLAALSIVKALLEVVCTLGSTVFVVILLLRVVWTAVSYFQSSENTSSKGRSSFGTTQPVA
ncbi:hypothetical protein DKX38_013386 [Salix brachista]|uniref:Uncharacterized protein n=1 Tax=Salix brachista TaxID=2182728 RepID=A0A5N5LR23_9ROSI|nr:hypothetical protein DKX38_013386 [Salix brachista]